MKFLKRTGNFLGRNGFFKAIGVDVFFTDSGSNELILAPITSKKVIGRCEIYIPAEDVPALLEEIEKKLPEGIREYFPVTRICRGDIEEKFGAEIANSMTDDDMRRIIKWMANAHLDDLYWESLKSSVEEILEERK